MWPMQAPVEDAAEACVCKDGYMFSEGEGFESGGDLVDLLHARTSGGRSR